MNIIEKRLSFLNDKERAWHASELRSCTRRSRKTVMKRTFSFIDLDQDPEVLQTLLLLAIDPCESVRVSAAYALGDHSSELSRKMLQTLLTDTFQVVRDAAKHAIERILENDKTVESLNKAIEERDALKASGKIQSRYKEIRAEQERILSEEIKLARSQEGRVFEFVVQGSRPYNIRACRSQDRFMIECNCAAGQENMLCKHILWLLEGDTSCLLSSNREDVPLLPILIKGTPAAEHFSFALGWLPESKIAFKNATQF